MKTYKREVAGAMLIGIAALAIVATTSEGALEVLRLLSPPVFLFAGGAFGMDALAKQINR